MGMDLRCLVFSSDDATANPICQALAELGAEAEHCTENVAAVQRVSNESFQIVIADWDEQPEAEFLLKAVRARKASERPLTLAVVSDDGVVPKALQAGANSILRKPILLNQVKDTLDSARSLLKARHDSVAAVASVSSAIPDASSPPTANAPETENHLRAGEFLQSGAPAPGAQFDTESDVPISTEQAAAEIDPLRELEPTAAAVAPEPAAPATKPPQSTEPRGLQWYLNQRSATLPSTPSVQMPAPPPPAQPELMGFDQMSAQPEAGPQTSEYSKTDSAPPPPQGQVQEQKAETELFAYIAGESSEPKERPRRQFRLNKGPIAIAVALAACAIVAAPQAPWHPQARTLWVHGKRTLHAWLNPQVVAPVQAPMPHEDFGRAGDEYKLPVPEAIPDATTDPSQIRVVPVVDPTAKKPDNAATNGAQPSADGNSTNPSDANQGGGAQSSPAQTQPTPGTAGTTGNPSGPAAAGSLSNSSATGSGGVSPIPAQPQSNPPTTSPTTSAGNLGVPKWSPPMSGAQPPTTIAKWTPPIVVPTGSNSGIPSSLKSQLASTTPDAGGNKSPDVALPSIEPVNVPEATERALLTGQTAIAYPPNAKGQQGTVVLQVLIGRDGTVQDAKFLQGSLAFARAAIDGVRTWKFKPYIFNGVPVSVQTLVTLTFHPGQ